VSCGGPDGESGGFAAVIVEGCLAAICEALDDPQPERKIRSDTVVGIAAAWPIRYGVHWCFAGNRVTAERLAFRFLLKWWQEKADPEREWEVDREEKGGR